MSDLCRRKFVTRGIQAAGGILLSPSVSWMPGVFSSPARKRITLWTGAEKGIYELDSSYFSRAGGLFDPVPHYEAMFEAVRK